MATLLMTPAYLKRHGLVDENVDSGYITPVIELCQDTFIQEIVGTGIFNELKTQIAANSLTTLNRTLLDDKLLPAMRWWVMAKLVKPITYKYSNTGIKQVEGDNYFTPSRDELNSLEEEYYNRSEYYADAAARYLIENSTSYPLYDNPGDGVDIVHPNRQQFKSAIFLGGRKGKCGNDYIDVDRGDRWEVCK